MTCLDGLASLPQLSAYSRDALARLKEEAIKKLNEIVPFTATDFDGPVFDPTQFVQLGSFAVKKGPLEAQPQVFNLTAPTSQSNAMRVLRACQLSKPILLEGSPGVGKTSLVTALANISGHHLCRINLSDQTDLIDLFGSDLPVEGGSPGEFAWRDAEFLKALQYGYWVLLDEMNLAPQTVLEGLNAVLDHRGTVYIPELNKSFTCHPSFRIFAAQNPINQGGGRKGLPKSFVNRFTKVYIEELTSADLNLVCQHMFPDMDDNVLSAMIAFNSNLNDEVTHRKTFGHVGAPWEFNLRDVIRWGRLMSSYSNRAPITFLRGVYLQRFRCNEDRRHVQNLFDAIFTTSGSSFEQAPPSYFSPSQLEIGHFITPRLNFSACTRPERLLKVQSALLETLGDCISQNWLAIVTGPRDSGKSHLIRALANFTGNPLCEISINSATDTMDIIGSFEQVDVRAQANDLIHDILQLAEEVFRNPKPAEELQNLISMRDSLNITVSRPLTQETVVTLLEQSSDFLSYLTDHRDTSGVFQERIEILLQSSSVGRFEWIDGPLVQAMRQGKWLLLDGANLCNPSILDRLNSLCEPNGQLSLNERGLIQGVVEVIKPHPDFRLFMTVDPQHGELSRAMRNRGIEIFVPFGIFPDDYLVILDHLRLPRLQTLTEHANLLSLNHMSSRRGLMKCLYQREKVATSSGRLLNQFAPLSNVMDRFPLYLIASNDIYLNASTFFLSRTFHPACFPYFRRVLDTCEGMSGDLKEYLHAFVNLLSSFPSSSIIDRIKEISTRVRKYSSEIFSAQVGCFSFT
jgi:midasin